MKIHAPVDINDYDERSFDRLISDVKAIIQKGLDEHLQDQRPRVAT